MKLKSKHVYTGMKKIRHACRRPTLFAGVKALGIDVVCFGCIMVLECALEAIVSPFGAAVCFILWLNDVIKEF